MRSKPRWGILTLVVVLAANAARGAEPCQGEFVGARLLGNLLDLSLTSDELKLLSKDENPKLRRHLEWRLVSAAADARRHVDEGPTLEKSAALPNLAHGVQQATEYVAAHHLDSTPPVPTAAESLGKPSANLDVVSKWIASQPR